MRAPHRLLRMVSQLFSLVAIDQKAWVAVTCTFHTIVMVNGLNLKIWAMKLILNTGNPNHHFPKMGEGYIL